MTQTRNKLRTPRPDITEERLESLRSLRAALRAVAGSAVLLFTVLAAYWPAIQHGGWIWDDDAHVTANPALRNPESLGSIWRSAQAVPPKQYYPLVHTTFWLQYPRGEGDFTCNLKKYHENNNEPSAAFTASTLKGAIQHEVVQNGHLMEPAAWPFHLVNVLLHAISAIVLWRLLRYLQIPGALAAAAIWALHPLNVESVAWVTERKNVLSGFFYFLTAAAYLRFEHLRALESEISNLKSEISNLKSEIPTPPSPWPWYAAALVLFAAALFSKTTASSLPAAILLILWWKRGSLSVRSIWPTIPFFGLGIALGLNTSRLETTPGDAGGVGAVGADWTIPFLHRLLIAGRAVWFYPWKLLWPAELTFSYERWSINPHLVGQWVYPLAALWLLGMVILLIRQLGRGPLASLLFYGGTILPAIGLFTLYPMRYTFVADHYQYLAGLGLIVPVVAGLTLLLRKALRQENLLRTATITAGALVLGLSVLTWRQSHIYASAETLWADTLAKNPKSWLARLHLVRIWTNEREPHNLQRAIDLARENLKVRPNEEHLYGQYASALDATGRTDDAKDAFILMLSKFPKSPEANHNLALIYLKTGDTPKAVAYFREELNVNHNKRSNLITRSALAEALLRLGLSREAEGELRIVVASDPTNTAARSVLATILLDKGRRPEAIRLLKEVCYLRPDMTEARLTLAQALFDTGQYREAKNEFDLCLRRDPDNRFAQNGSRACALMLRGPKQD